MDEQVTLSSYTDQVRELIRHDRNDEAIAICKHLLRYYPKYINAYRQLGEALLEKQIYDGAKDVFQRVLSADPENAIAYVGLATIFEQEQVINEAVWNMERAFELAPGNSELQQELVRLYNALDIKAHTRAKLTTGALGRMYAQESLFPQAIQEFRAIIVSAPSRYDIRVALAEALWRMGRMSEAAQVAQSILEYLPYCLKANLILGAAWKEIGLTESEPYLQRAQMLDPTNQTAARLFGAHSPVPVLRTSVPRYNESTEPSVAERLPTSAPSTSLFEGVLTESPADYVPAESAIETAIAEEPAAPATIDDNLPVWLRRPVGETVAETKIEATDAMTDWLSKLREMPAEETAETPAESAPTIDWLKLPNPEDEAQSSAPGERETLPTWLDRAPSESITETPTVERAPETESTESIPAWMRGSPQSSEPVTSATKEPATTEELPPWLASTPVQTTLRTEELPTWLEPPTVSPVADTKPESTVEVEEKTPAISETPHPIAPVEEKISPSAFEPPALAEPAPVALPAEAPSIVVELPPSPPMETSVVETPAEPKRKRQPKGYGHLIQARAHRDAQRWNDALTEYDYLVQHAPRLVRDVIDDLEVLIQRIDMPLEAHRILGDAYTRADRLAEALERYRFVLEHVSQ